ncbi:MAG TPA: hypothetical protein VIT23_04335 [Terrimicrobiaceae bacterium]
MNPLSEKKESLWLLAVSPTIWAVHFLLCYLTAAIWCEKFANSYGTLGGVRVAIVVYTIVALVGIGLNGWSGWQRNQYGAKPTSQDFDTPEDRHRFLGFATLLLSVLSATATLFAAMVALYFEDCR